MEMPWDGSVDLLYLSYAFQSRTLEERKVRLKQLPRVMRGGGLTHLQVEMSIETLDRKPTSIPFSWSSISCRKGES